MFVRRNERGEITSVSREPTPELSERLDGNDSSLQQFLGSVDKDGHAALEASDLEVIRVLEDLVEVLIERGVIQFTDLPEAAQSKLMKRRNIRRAGAFTLFEEGDEGVF